jgi:ABC-type bacteriocin/lantibiotic exporter with double-glycine peptidase domain
MSMKVGESRTAAGALTILTRYAELDVDPARIRFLVGEDPHGSNLLRLIRVTKAIGFRVEATTLDWDTLAGARFPLIARLLDRNRDGYFVVVSGVFDDSVVLVGSGLELRRIEREEFCCRWMGWVLSAWPAPRRRAVPLTEGTGT